MKSESAANLVETKVKEIENGQGFLQQLRRDTHEDSAKNFFGHISKYDGAVVDEDGDISDSSKYFTAREEEDSGHFRSKIDEEIASFKGTPRSSKSLNLEKLCELYRLDKDDVRHAKKQLKSSSLTDICEATTDALLAAIAFDKAEKERIAAMNI